MVDETTSLITPPPGDEFLSPDVDGVWTKPKEEKFDLNWGFFLIALLGVFIAFCDDSFVISTHEEIASSFNQLSISYWLVTVFKLGWAVALPIYGRLHDMYGGKNTLLAGYILYAAGCTITGTAVSMQIAVFGRLIAGIGASGITDFISVLIVEMAPLRQVAMLRMYIGAVTMSGVGMGAPLGGLITSLVGWRWSFLGQTPILLVCLVMVTLKLPKHTSEEAQLRPAQEDGDFPEERSMDFVGIAFLGIAAASFILMCSAFTDESWLNAIKWGLLVALILFGALFIVNEAFWAKDPLIPLELAVTNGIGLVWLTHILLNIAFFSLYTNIGEFFVRTEYASTSTVGLYMVPLSIGLIVGQIIGGQYIKRTARYKFFSVLCLGLCLLGFFLVMLRWPSGPSHWELLYIFFLSIGASGVLASQFVGLSASAPQETLATAVTVYYMSQQLGMVGGTTLASTISRAVLRRGLLRKFGTGTEEIQVIRKVLSNTHFAQSLPDYAQHIIRSTYLESFRTVPIISLCAVLLAFPLLVFQTEHPLS